jgi:hypothetical protein
MRVNKQQKKCATTFSQMSLVFYNLISNLELRQLEQCPFEQSFLKNQYSIFWPKISQPCFCELLLFFVKFQILHHLARVISQGFSIK